MIVDKLAIFIFIFLIYYIKYVNLFSQVCDIKIILLYIQKRITINKIEYMKLEVQFSPRIITVEAKLRIF